MIKREACLTLAFLVAVSGFFVTLTFAPATVTASTLFVGGTGPGNYTTIQNAVDMATSGSTVFVYGGTYYENVNISKTITLVGEDRSTTVVDNRGAWPVIKIEADWVNVTGITVNDSRQWVPSSPSIHLLDVNNCRITNTNVSNGHYTILLENSHRNEISDNIFYNSDWRSVKLKYSDNNRIENNTGFGDDINLRPTIELGDSKYNIISGNLLIEGGIDLWSGNSYNTIIGNNITKGSIEVAFGFGNNTITGNYVSEGSIYISESTHNDIVGNHLVRSDYGGIGIGGGAFNFISNNTIVDSVWYGIRLSYSRNTILRDNYMNNGGLSFEGYELWHFNTHDIDTSNVVGGLPVRYLKDCVGSIIDGIPTAQVILANCQNAVIRNLNLGNVYRSTVLAFSDGTNVTGNRMTESLYDVIYLYESSWNNISDNDIEDNYKGVRLDYSDNNTVGWNRIRSTVYGGISIERYSHYNKVVGNDIWNNGGGIGASIGANRNQFIGNSIWNSAGGIGFSSEYNVAYHNNIMVDDNHAVNLYFMQNWWDNGYPSGGNYWSNYTGVDDCSGPLQNICPDPDGIGDTKYAIYVDAWDNYPLMEPYGGDRFPPEVTITFPPDGWTHVSNQILVEGSAKDNGHTGVDFVVVRVNGVSWVTAQGANDWDLNVDLVEGTNLIEAKAWDVAGNPSEIESVRVTYVLPSTLRGRVLGLYSDPVQNAQVDLEGENVTYFERTTTDSFGRFQFDDIPPGNYTVTIKAAGYEDLTVQYIDVPSGSDIDLGDLVMVDINNPPVAVFTVSPTSGFANTSFTFNASWSTDEEDSLAELQFRWDWENDGAWDTTWTSESVKTHIYDYPSTYVVRLEVMDSEGLTDNDTRLVVVWLHQVNHPPTCEITRPTHDQSVSDVFLIEGFSYDQDGVISFTEIRIDDGPWITLSEASWWSYHWDTRTVSNGDHTIYARSFDGENFSNIDSVMVTVYNPGYDLLSDERIVLLLLVMIVTISLVLTFGVVFALIKRGEREKDEPQPPPDTELPPPPP